MNLRDPRLGDSLHPQPRRQNQQQSVSTPSNIQHTEQHQEQQLQTMAKDQPDYVSAYSHYLQQQQQPIQQQAQLPQPLNNVQLLQFQSNLAQPQQPLNASAQPTQLQASHHQQQQQQQQHPPQQTQQQPYQLHQQLSQQALLSPQHQVQQQLQQQQQLLQHQLQQMVGQQQLQQHQLQQQVHLAGQPLSTNPATFQSQLSLPPQIAETLTKLLAASESHLQLTTSIFYATQPLGALATQLGHLPTQLSTVGASLTSLSESLAGMTSKLTTLDTKMAYIERRVDALHQKHDVVSKKRIYDDNNNTLSGSSISSDNKKPRSNLIGLSNSTNYASGMSNHLQQQHQQPQQQPLKQYQENMLQPQGPIHPIEHRNLCYNCGGHNHQAKFCPQPRRTCHRCGKLGHIVQFCHQKAMGSENVMLQRQSQSYSKYDAQDRHSHHVSGSKTSTSGGGLTSLSAKTDYDVALDYDEPSMTSNSGDPLAFSEEYRPLARPRPANAGSGSGGGVSTVKAPSPAIISRTTGSPSRLGDRKQTKVSRSTTDNKIDDEEGEVSELLGGSSSTQPSSQQQDNAVTSLDDDNELHSQPHTINSQQDEVVNSGDESNTIYGALSTERKNKVSDGEEGDENNDDDDNNDEDNEDDDNEEEESGNENNGNESGNGNGDTEDDVDEIYGLTDPVNVFDATSLPLSSAATAVTGSKTRRESATGEGGTGGVGISALDMSPLSSPSWSPPHLPAEDVAMVTADNNGDPNDEYIEL